MWSSLASCAWQRWRVRSVAVKARVSEAALRCSLAAVTWSSAPVSMARPKQSIAAWGRAMAWAASIA
jgi:hypothetical protein